MGVAAGRGARADSPVRQKKTGGNSVGSDGISSGQRHSATPADAIEGFATVAASGGHRAGYRRRFIAADDFLKPIGFHRASRHNPGSG